MAQIYMTPKERTVKCATVEDAVKAALTYLTDKHNLTRVCTNAVSKRDNYEKITLQELNKISQDLIDDTLYHEGMWL